MTPAEIQAQGLLMLKFVDGICRREKLTYWLSGGTLLGAVRHKDFIPWDDDVDLMMPRPDYERLVSIAKGCATDRYAFAHPRLQKDYATPWLRVYDLRSKVRLSNMVKFGSANLFLDIFPVDALPSNPWLCKLYFKRVRLRDILLKCSRKTDLWQNERLPVLKRFLMAVTSVLPTNFYARWVDRFCSSGNYERARYAGVCVVTHYSDRERMPAEVFKSTVKLTFCDGEYPAPVGWDTYLRNLYGDYMQLPPEDKRRSFHRLRATLIDDDGE